MEIENDVEVEPVEEKVVVRRKLTNEDVIKYEPMVEKFIRDSCMKNWNESRTGGGDVPLGASGYTLNDLRQHLRAEICVALQNYNPDYRTKEGRSVKESTFIYQHLTFRVGQLMKRLTKKRSGYGVRHNPVHLVIENGVEETDYQDLDLGLAIDKRAEIANGSKRQVERFLETKAKNKKWVDLR
jgi:hypothetical protein